MHSEEGIILLSFPHLHNALTAQHPGNHHISLHIIFHAANADAWILPLSEIRDFLPSHNVHFQELSAAKEDQGSASIDKLHPSDGYLQIGDGDVMHFLECVRVVVHQHRVIILNAGQNQRPRCGVLCTGADVVFVPDFFHVITFFVVKFYYVVIAAQKLITQRMDSEKFWCFVEVVHGNLIQRVLILQGGDSLPDQRVRMWGENIFERYKRPALNPVWNQPDEGADVFFAVGEHWQVEHEVLDFCVLAFIDFDAQRNVHFVKGVLHAQDASFYFLRIAVVVLELYRLLFDGEVAEGEGGFVRDEDVSAYFYEFFSADRGFWEERF